MAQKRRSSPPPTPADVETALDELFQNISKATGAAATGSGYSRPRFKNFRIKPWLKELIQEAVNLFDERDLEGALEKTRQAQGALTRVQWGFFFGSYNKYFAREIKRLIDASTDRDLIEAVQSRANEVHDYESKPKHERTLDDASRIYWAAEEAIRDAWRERNRRERSRERQRRKTRTEVAQRRRAQFGTQQNAQLDRSVRKFRKRLDILTPELSLPKD